jgi:F-type H+-transporting ATPase subunit a
VDAVLNAEELGARIIVGFGEGNLFLTESTLWGFILAAVLASVGIWLGSGLKPVPATRRQQIAELIVEKVYHYTEDNLGKEYRSYAPYMGTIFVYVVTGSALGILGLRPITADINVTFGLALLSFLLIQISSIRKMGLRGRLHHLCQPYAFMFPLHIIEEVTLPVSLAFRLFGNIFGGLVVVELWFVFMEWLSGFLSDVPVLRAVLVLPLNTFFDIFEPFIQTYIFVTLTMVFLSQALAEGHRDR